MRVKANVSFAGVISMVAGEERECTEGSTLSDLLASGLVAPVQPVTPKEPEKDEPPAPLKEFEEDVQPAAPEEPAKQKTKTSKRSGDAK